MGIKIMSTVCILHKFSLIQNMIREKKENPE